MYVVLFDNIKNYVPIATPHTTWFDAIAEVYLDLKSSPLSLSNKSKVYLCGKSAYEPNK